MAVEYSRPYINVIIPSLFTSSLFTAHGWGLERQKREMNLPFYSSCCCCFLYFLYCCFFVAQAFFSLFIYFFCNTSNEWFHTCMPHVYWLDSSMWIVPLSTRGGSNFHINLLVFVSLWISKYFIVYMINNIHHQLHLGIFKHSWQTSGPPALYFSAVCEVAFILSFKLSSWLEK